MPTKRLTMRRIQRLMTLHFGAGAGTRVIARELGISHSTVREYLARIRAAGITWPLPAELTDQELERQLFVNAGSLIVTSQLPVDRWYELVGNSTLS